MQRHPAKKIIIKILIKKFKDPMKEYSACCKHARDTKKKDRERKTENTGNTPNWKLPHYNIPDNLLNSKNDQSRG
jgi:hypothetical protein